MNQEVLNRSFLDLDASLFREFDAQIIDPPYSKHVHSSAVSCGPVKGVTKREFGFDSLSSDLAKHIAKAAAGVRGYSVIFSDVESAQDMRKLCEQAGAEYVRTVPWVRWSMPQLSGDRPPQGQEKVVVVQAPEDEPLDIDVVLAYPRKPNGKPQRKSWNGRGNLTHFDHKCLRGKDKYKAEKPLDLMLDLVASFTNPGDSVVDGCTGVGTTLLACKILGRDALGFETRRTVCDDANRRLRRETLSDRDAERMKRWLARDPKNHEMVVWLP